jgi:transcriptional regulator with XRE-family HTH domain
MQDEALYLAIGQRLRARRRLVDMTQKQVAVRCGLTFQQIQKYEAGAVAMPVARLVAVADALSAPLDELLAGLRPSPPPSRPSLDAAARPARGWVLQGA